MCCSASLARCETVQGQVFDLLVCDTIHAQVTETSNEMQRVSYCQGMRLVNCRQGHSVLQHLPTFGSGTHLHGRCCQPPGKGLCTVHAAVVPRLSHTRRRSPPTRNRDTRRSSPRSIRDGPRGTMRRGRLYTLHDKAPTHPT